jgi:hypothetical protein
MYLFVVFFELSLANFLLNFLSQNHSPKLNPWSLSRAETCSVSSMFQCQWCLPACLIVRVTSVRTALACVFVHMCMYLVTSAPTVSGKTLVLLTFWRFPSLCAFVYVRRVSACLSVRMFVHMQLGPFVCHVLFIRIPDLVALFCVLVLFFLFLSDPEPA